MAYARRYTKRAPARRPRPAKRPARKVAVPKKKRTAKTYVRSNALAVNSINRELKLMKLRLHGKYQTNRQYWDLIQVNSKVSYAIPLDQFDCRRSINKINASGQPYVSNVIGTSLIQCIMTPGTADYGVLAGTDSKYTLESITGADGSVNPLWNANNQNIPDGGQYFCHGATYDVEIEGIADNRYITFRMFTVKPEGFVKSTGFGDSTASNSVKANETLMPICMKYFTDMARPSGVNLPPNRFKTYWTKRIYLNSMTHADGNSSNATTSGRRSFRFSINPNKVVKQHTPVPNDMNDPAAGSTTLPSGTYNSYPLGPFGPSNRPLFDPIWLMFTTDVPPKTTEEDPEYGTDQAVTEDIRVRISRTCRWRDNVGGQI